MKNRVLRKLYIFIILFSALISLKAENYHIVQKGDTLYSLARQYQIPLKELQSLNKVQSRIYPGQKLKIPGDYFYYTVNSGDTYYSIAAEFSLPVKELMDYNLAVKSTIYPGALLKIPGENRYSDTIPGFSKLPPKAQGILSSSPIHRKRFKQALKEISKTPELYIPVSRSNPLAPDYMPSDLIPLPGKLRAHNKTILIKEIILADLLEMAEEAEKSGIPLLINSGFRDYNRQKELLAQYTKEMGKTRAESLSALPGTSEHHLGTALDFKLSHNAKAEAWLTHNAPAYGFTISYPKGMKNKTGYIYEPWHLRYLGKSGSYLVKTYFNGLSLDFLQWIADIKLLSTE